MSTSSARVASPSLLKRSCAPSFDIPKPEDGFDSGRQQAAFFWAEVTARMRVPFSGIRNDTVKFHRTTTAPTDLKPKKQGLLSSHLLSIRLREAVLMPEVSFYGILPTH